MDPQNLGNRMLDSLRNKERTKTEVRGSRINKRIQWFRGTRTIGKIRKIFKSTLLLIPNLSTSSIES